MSTYHPKPFTNNTSGNLNKKLNNQYKQIDLDDLDVQMMSPQFLQIKTLKKPLQEFDLTLSKTNPQGVRQYSSERQMPTQDRQSAVIFQKAQLNVQQKKNNTLSVIDTSGLNIKPAYKNCDQGTFTLTKSTNIEIPKDGNTIFAAIMKKGLKPQVTVQPEKVMPKEQKKVGPAENKLKAMMGKRDFTPSIEVNGPKHSKKNDNRFKNSSEEIGEQIGQDIDEYGNESFEKLSIGYESAIKESIVEQSAIKESIRQSIRESIIKESIQGGSSGAIKESIRQDIKESYGGSSRSLKEQIFQQISASKPKSKESVQEIYQDVFEDIEGSNSLSRSRGGFKKSYNQKQFDSLSQSASKSFRMKTNVVKSLKYAQELVKKQKQQIAPKKIDDPAMFQAISKQKLNVKRLQENISKFMNKQQKIYKPEKMKDLYYHFKIQLSKLIASQNFQSKLKRLASFLSSGSESSQHRRINELEDNILSNVMTQIENIKTGKSHLSEIQKVKQDYQNKLKEQMLIQEVKLRSEMNQKLSEKDFQLKKMIAQLQSRMMSRSFAGDGKAAILSKAEPYQVDSDISIDSNNVSWKADLWQLLPQFQKKKLYDKQSAQVTKFLADIMINELQGEALDRSVDISFEFPEEYNNIPVNSMPVERSSAPVHEQSLSFIKPVQSRRQQKVSSQFLSDLPKLNIKKAQSVQSNSSDKEDLKTERIRRDEKIKPEIIKILSDYKTIYLRKKQEVIRNLLKIILSRDGETKNYMLSAIQQLSILNERQFRKDHKVYIKAYEQQLFMNLVGIYNRSINKKQSSIEQQMKKMYDRLVVVCQVSVAQKCTERVALDAQKHMNYNVQVLTKEAIGQMERHPCLIEITTNQNYMDLKTKLEEKDIKNEVVNHIVNILITQFAKEFPKKKK